MRWDQWRSSCPGRGGWSRSLVESKHLCKANVRGLELAVKFIRWEKCTQIYWKRCFFSWHDKCRGTKTTWCYDRRVYLTEWSWSCTSAFKFRDYFFNFYASFTHGERGLKTESAFYWPVLEVTVCSTACFCRVHGMHKENPLFLGFVCSWYEMLLREDCGAPPGKPRQEGRGGSTGTGAAHSGDLVFRLLLRHVSFLLWKWIRADGASHFNAFMLSNCFLRALHWPPPKQLFPPCSSWTLPECPLGDLSVFIWLITGLSSLYNHQSCFLLWFHLPLLKLDF